MRAIKIHVLAADLSEALSLLKEWQDTPLPDYNGRQEYEAWMNDFQVRVHALVSRYEWALKFWIKPGDIAD